MLVPSRCNVINNTQYLDTAILALALRKHKMDYTPVFQTAFHPPSAKPSLIEALLHPTSCWMLTHLLDCNFKTTTVPQWRCLHCTSRRSTICLSVHTGYLTSQSLSIANNEAHWERVNLLLYCSPQTHHPLQKTIWVLACCSVSRAHIQHNITLAAQQLWAHVTSLQQHT